ncbi:MAG: hypothetical protein Q8N73_01215 [bacterium]|nr:hypothetical protein [bacterium]
MEENNPRINTKLLIIISFLLFFLAGVANAATLYLYPSSGSYSVGQNFSVMVYVSSSDQAMNAASGAISFSQDKLQVVSLSKSGSIFSLWVQEPSFSNLSGTINFEGIVLNPGFTGSAGKIITLNFKARATGNASLTFSSGSILANDGKGTNILTSMGSANYFFQTTEITPPTEEIIPPATLGVLLAPKVSSPTHPDPEKWYSNNNPEFTWKLPPDVTGVSIFLNEKSVSNPGPISDGLIESKKYENLEDGIYYFHIKFQNNYGWGKITHRKVLIDTVPPLSFEVKTQQEDSTDPQPILLFETRDELSGLEYYEIKIGEGNPFPITTEEVKSNPYKMPLQAPGKHSIENKAFDRTGNYTSAFTEVEILAIETPIITKYPKRLNLGETLNLEGKSLPDVTILVFIQQKGKELIIGETKANGDGFWQFSSSKTLEKGEYKAWAQAKDKRGALSLPSNIVSFEVGLPPFLKFGKIVIDYLTIMITLIVLIIGVIAIILYTWYRISLWRKKLRTETKELAQTIYGAFRALREEVQEQIEYLDKKPGLTKGEKEIRDKLQEALDISEKFISKELKDVEKELE